MQKRNKGYQKAWCSFMKTRYFWLDILAFVMMMTLISTIEDFMVFLIISLTWFIHVRMWQRLEIHLNECGYTMNKELYVIRDFKMYQMGYEDGLYDTMRNMTSLERKQYFEGLK